MRHALADLPWPDVGGRVTADSVLAVPLGATEQHGPHLPLLRAGGVRAVSETGVLGDPAGATAGAGRALLDGLSAALIREVAAWHPGVPG